MGKKIKEGDCGTHVLFQKSNQTILTQSRTCSGVSQICTKSGHFKIKSNVSRSKEYYTDGNTLKRDLSIETDVCIIRRYVKKYRNRLSLQEGSKSKYSTVVETEVDTADNYQHDSSACGDSERTDAPTNVQLDITKIVMDNFKELVNNWIRNYLLEDKETKEKLETVLYSILHKRASKTNNSSSRSTYVLNKESRLMDDRKRGYPIICQCCSHRAPEPSTATNDVESISHSTPVSGKKVKLISTLSIPRNIHKKNPNKTKEKHNDIAKNKENIILSLNKSGRLDLSSFDFLSASAESFTKRCVNYEATKTNKKKRHIVFYPKPFYKSATESSKEDNEIKKVKNRMNLSDMTSLMQSIYADDPANVTSTDNYPRIFKMDNYTMTDDCCLSIDELLPEDSIDIDSDAEMKPNKQSVSQQYSNFNELDQSEPLISIDFVNESGEPSKTTNTRTESKKTVDERNYDSDKIFRTNPTNIKFFKRSKKQPKQLTIKKCSRFKPWNRITKSQDLSNKHFTFLYKNANTEFRQNKNFMKHCHKIIKYFCDNKGADGVRLNINISVSPGLDTFNKDTCTASDKQNILNPILGSDTVVYKIEPKLQSNNENTKEKSHTNIIPILDGTISHSKYLLKSDSSTLNEKNDGSTVVTDGKTTVTDRSTLTEAEIINEIKELKAIIRDLIEAADVVVKEHKKKELMTSKYTSDCTKNASKGIQISNEKARRYLLSGIKLSKEPKKTKETRSRLAKKSVSYNVIDSEVVLKVTDMTSAANNKIYPPKSKSLIEVTNRKEKQKLLTYFVDREGEQLRCIPRPIGFFTKKCQHKPQKIPLICTLDSGESLHSLHSECTECEPKMTCSSVQMDECDDNGDEERDMCLGKAMQHSLAMGFGEGFIYCVILWIPVFIVMWLFYCYVLKDQMVVKNPVIGREKSNDDFIARSLNGSIFYVKLSDLGF